MQQGRTLGVGLVGCGNVGVNRHLPALQALPDTEVVALADTDQGRLTRAADRFGIEGRYGDARVLLEDSAVEVVAICTPPGTHVEIALAALEAGKHVFIEKPLSLSLDECDRLIERAAESACKVMVGFNMRWHRLVRQARGIIEGNGLGALKAIQYVATGGHHKAETIWLRNRVQGGGVLIESAVHAFDLWRFLLQSEVEEVFALSQPGIWEDETATITARMANGVLTTTLLIKGAAENHEIEIYGQDGRLSLCRYRWDGLQVYPAGQWPSGLGHRLRSTRNTLEALPQALPSIRQGGDLAASFQAEWHDFASSIRHEAPVGCTLGDGRAAVQVALAAAASASSGTALDVCEAPREIAPNVTADGW